MCAQSCSMNVVARICSVKISEADPRRLDNFFFGSNSPQRLWRTDHFSVWWDAWQQKSTAKRVFSSRKVIAVCTSLSTKPQIHNASRQSRGKGRVLERRLQGRSLCVYKWIAQLRIAMVGCGPDPVVAPPRCTPTKKFRTGSKSTVPSSSTTLSATPRRLSD